MVPVVVICCPFFYKRVRSGLELGVRGVNGDFRDNDSQLTSFLVWTQSFPFSFSLAPLVQVVLVGRNVLSRWRCFYLLCPCARFHLQGSYPVRELDE